jgi:uncharacterized protein (TIGR02996 family)
MNERDAILAGIRANPNDDVYRLAYADWCDEQSRRVWDSVVAVRAEIIETMGSETHCNYCGIDTRPYHEHVVTCLVRKLWTDEDELKRSPDYARQCVQVATAEYIRLTCDVPKKGPGKNLAMWRADEWLRANWKRLVPTLTTEFDNFPDEYWTTWNRHRSRPYSPTLGGWEPGRGGRRPPGASCPLAYRSPRSVTTDRPGHTSVR